MGYFYVIQDKRNGKLYGGSRYGKYVDTNPTNFMTPNGYTTSSTLVNTIIDEYGIDVFDVVYIVEDENSDKLETEILTHYNVQFDDRWYNMNNGCTPPSSLGTVGYTNGEKNIRVRDSEDIPDGFYKGFTIKGYPKNRKKRSKEDNLKCRHNKGKKCYTNGKRNIYLSEGEEIPEGFTPGSKVRHKGTNYRDPVKVKVEGVLYNSIKECKEKTGYHYNTVMRLNEI